MTTSQHSQSGGLGADVLVVTREEVHRILRMGDCIDLLGEAFRKLASDQVQLPLRTVMWLKPEQKNAFALMPCSMAVQRDPALDQDEEGDSNELVYFGAKILSVFFTNIGTAHESHQGVVLLFEGKYGRLRAIIDASSITQIRTAAASGLATKYLARDEPTKPLTLGLLGSGVQAESHLEAMLSVRSNIATVNVWSRQIAKAESFVKQMKTKFAGLEIKAVPTPHEALTDADIVCTTTASTVPVTEYTSLKKGVHINAIGASSPKTREIDSETMKNASIFTDRRESIMSEAGDFLIPIAEGHYGESHLRGELADLVTNALPGRTSPDEITIFKSLGLAVEDLASAIYIYRQAKAERRQAAASTSPSSLLWIQLEAPHQ